jgi:hypothetical protein
VKKSQGAKGGVSALAEQPEKKGGQAAHGTRLFINGLGV